MKKIILISGATKNLGYFLGNYFQKKNYSIINLSRNIDSKNNFNNFKCNLEDENQTNNIFKIVKKRFSKIDLIISCAGKSKKNFSKIEAKVDFEKSFEDNFYSLVNLISSYTHVYKFKSTKIIAISSIAGNKITQAPITYSVAKSALNFYSKYKAKELAKYNISLNTISPGNILQPDNNWDKKIKKDKVKILKYIKEKVPMNKFCRPIDIAEYINFILLSKNNITTGSNFVIDGGEIL
jgi:3-oxoacyl-[acyl-carrier protein] reductase